MIHIFGRHRFAFGQHSIIGASLLGKMKAGNPVKGAFADRSPPKSMVLNVNQLLIWYDLKLI
jgi:hypothetical protein